MAEPARKIEEGDQSLSAQDKANQRWGLANSEDDPALSNQEPGYQTPLEQARSNWGQASVIEGPGGEASGARARDLVSAEKSNHSAANDAELDELGALDSGGFYNPENNKQDRVKSRSERIKGFIANKKTAGGLLGGGGVIGLLVGGFIGIQPLQILQLSKVQERLHFSKQSSAHDSSKRRTYNTVTGNRQYNNLGLLGSQLAQRNVDRLTQKGITPEFRTQAGSNRSVLQSLRVDTKTAEGKRLLAQAKSLGLQIDGNTIRTRGIADIPKVRAITKQMVVADGKKGISGAVAKRRLNKLFGVNFRPMTLIKRGTESRTEYKNKVREKKSEDFKRNARTAGGLPTEARGENPGTPENRTKMQRIRTSGLLRGGATAAVVAGIFCTVKDIGDEIPVYRMANVIQPMVKMSWDVMSTASAIQAGENITADEVGAISSAFYDGENSWAAAKPFVTANANSSDAGGIDIDAASKDQIEGAYSGDKPLVFEAVDKSSLLLSPVCAALDLPSNTPVVGDVINFVSEEIIGRAVKFGTGKDPSEWLGDLVAWLGGEAVNTFAEGSEYGNLIAYGGRIAANSSSSGAGGIPLTSAEVAEWEAYQKQERYAELKEKNILARLFDPNQVDSVTSVALFESTPAMGPQALANSIKSKPFFALGTPIRFSKTALNNPTFAQEANVNAYDYAGIPQVGVPLSLLNDERYEDIYENIERLEQTKDGVDNKELREANDLWGKCFGYPLDENEPWKIADQSVEDNPELYSQIESDDCVNARTNQRFRDFQMYILDNVTIKSMACYEGISDESCSEVGFQSGSGSAPTSPGGTLPSGSAQELARQILNSSNINIDEGPRSQIEGVANGQGPCPTVNNGQYTISEDLLRVVAAIGADNTFTITSLHRGCTSSTVGSGTASRHWTGDAVDFSGSRGINGVTMPSFGAYDTIISQFSKDLAALLPDGDYGLGLPNNNYISDVSSVKKSSTSVFLDTRETTGATAPHIHLQAPRR